MKLLSSVLIVLFIVFSTTAFAQTRTTPVEVQNTPTVSVTNIPTVKLDAANNTVAAQQSGTWTVGLNGTPSVNVANLPTVKIDSTQNTVTTVGKCSTIQLWSSTQTVDSGATLSSTSINCGGYREMKIVLFTPYTYTDMNLIRINVRFETPAGGMCLIGYGNFGTPSTSLTSDANFVQTGNAAYLSVPVISGRAMIEVVNNRSTSISITSSCWVYLVN